MAPARRRIDPAGLQSPVALMTAAPITAWPTGGTYLVEPKFDGWRTCLFRLPDQVWLQSRNGRNLARYFADIVIAAQALPVGTVIDGELVIWAGDRTDFTLLQQRITTSPHRAPTHPAHLVVFDLLQHPVDGVLADRPLTERRARLTDVIATAPTAFALCPQGDTWVQADDWM
jgi:ATP-dependent DNA ligase